MRRFAIVLAFALAPACRVSVCPGQTQGSATFCRADGSEVKPAGMNYTHVKKLAFDYTATAGWKKDDIVHSTLITGLYDPARVDAALDQMAAGGYNFIRVFLAADGAGYDTKAGNAGPYHGIGGPWTIGPDHVNGLYRPYLDNFVDLLRRAMARGMWVQPTFELLPMNAHYHIPYSDWPRARDGSPIVEGINAYYLAQKWIDKKKEYVAAVLAYVRDTDPQLQPGIIAIDLQNEIFVDTKAAPFSRRDVVTLADGPAYDMTKDADRQQAVDAGFVHWANELVAAAHSVDPQVMVGASVFTFGAIGLGGANGVHSNPNLPSETRYPARPWSLATYSNLSYTAIHVYLANPPAGGVYNLGYDVETSELSKIPTHAKPLWLGEFGTFRSVYGTSAAAAPAVKAHKDALVARGFKAWAYWTWDINLCCTIDAVDNFGSPINTALNPTQNGF